MKATGADVAERRPSWLAIRVLFLLLAIPLTIPHEGVAVGSRPVAAVALAGDVAPGTGGATFTGFDEPFVNATGQVVFAGSYTGGGGVFFKSAGSLSAIVASGQAIPGLGTVTLNNAFDVDGPALNNRGTVIFATRGGNTPALIQKKSLGALTVLAKQGNTAPGTGGGVFDRFDDMAVNNNDGVAFIATYTNDGGVTFKTGVFFKPDGGAITPIVLNGDTLPGTGGGTQCGTDQEDIDGPWLNDLGVVAFAADAICGGTGGLEGSVFAKRPGNPIETFVLMSDSPPGSIGGTISDIKIGRPGLNNSNTLGVTLDISGGSVEKAVVTKVLGGSSTVCVKVGDAAPDTDGTFTGFAAPAINQHGELFLEADVTLANTSEIQGIFACLGGLLRAAVLDGDPIPGTSGIFDAPEEGSIGDNGQMVFLSENAPAGVFVGGATAIPTLSEWAAIVMVALLVGVAVWTLRQRHHAQAPGGRPA